MKKLLALVLALVMTLSLAVVGSNAAFKDADKVSATYAEAVDVLAGMKVFQGYTDGTFQPEGSITRAEVAAIVYRLYTGDVADKQASLYATYNKFTDMNGAAWAAGYIGYCANAGLIKGYDAKTFGPSDKVTGYQALAMILRAVGYDKNDEFTGAQWQLRVASTAQQLGILKNVKGVDLNAAASRELVAELLFRTAAEVPMVTYTPALGYTNLNALINGQKNDTLGYKNFGLTKDTTYGTDAWGRPAYVWYGEYNKTANYQAKSTDVLYATVKATPDATYNKAVAQCDVAKDAGLTAKVTTFDVYYNSAVKTGTQDIASLATTAKIGAQGQQVEVYVAAKRIVIVDTFLAYVKSVKEATYDKNGHLSTEATIVLNIFDGKTATRSLSAIAKDTTKEYVLTNGSDNYTYAAGDMVLVNVHTNANAVATKDFWKNGDYAEIIGKAESLDGAQTQIWYAAEQHTVNGTTYDDADKFILDEADTGTGAYTWYFDQFGNLIGDVLTATNYSYAAVKALWWLPDGTTGSGVAKATLVYMDGKEDTVTVSGIKFYNDAKALTPIFSGYYSTTTAMTADSKYLYVAMDATVNALSQTNTHSAKKVITTDLFRASATADGTYLLEEIENELTSAHITSKYAPITGTAAKANDAASPKITSVNTNADTQYLLYNTTTKKFETLSGYNNIYDFVKNAVAVDYVLASTGYAKYVYLVGTPDQTTAYNFVLIQNPNRSALLKDNAVEYYNVTFANVNGEQTSLKVLPTTTVTVNGQQKLLVDVLTDTANLNKLYYVTFTGEYATGIVEINAIGMSNSTLTGLAANVRASKLVDADNNQVVLTGTDLAQGIYHFNVSAATENVGSLTANARQTGKIVYVISDATNNTATKVYVVDNKDYAAGTSTYPNTVLSANVPALTAPTAFGAAVKTVDIPAANWVSSTGTAIADGAAMKANVQWQVYSFTEGKYVDYNQAYFQAGNRYQAVVTVYVDNTNTTTYPYILANNFAVSYNGTAQAANGFVVSFDAI